MRSRCQRRVLPPGGSTQSAASARRGPLRSIARTGKGDAVVQRRDFLIGSGLAGAAALRSFTACAPPPDLDGVFSVGVASGLHSPTAAVLWTRVDLANAHATTSVGW